MSPRGSPVAVRSLSDDDRAVSELIGTIMLLAVTVIAATMVGVAIVATVQGSVSGDPTLSADVVVNGSEVAVEHRGGDRLALDELDVVVSNETGRRSVDLANASALTAPVGDGDEWFEPGETARFSRDLTGDAEVFLVHRGSNAVLAEHRYRTS